MIPEDCVGARDACSAWRVIHHPAPATASSTMTPTASNRNPRMAFGGADAVVRRFRNVAV
jgi:hypothetical protein